MRHLLVQAAVFIFAAGRHALASPFAIQRPLHVAVLPQEIAVSEIVVRNLCDGIASSVQNIVPESSILGKAITSQKSRLNCLVEGNVPPFHRVDDELVALKLEVSRQLIFFTSPDGHVLEEASDYRPTFKPIADALARAVLVNIAKDDNSFGGLITRLPIGIVYILQSALAVVVQEAHKDTSENIVALSRVIESELVHMVDELNQYKSSPTKEQLVAATYLRESSSEIQIKDIGLVLGMLNAAIDASYAERTDAETTHYASRARRDFFFESMNEYVFGRIPAHDKLDRVNKVAQILAQQHISDRLDDFDRQLANLEEHTGVPMRTVPIMLFVTPAHADFSPGKRVKIVHTYNINAVDLNELSE